MEKTKVTFEDENGEKIIVDISLEGEDMDITMKFEPPVNEGTDGGLKMAMFNLFYHHLKEL